MSGTIKDKLEYLNETKREIRKAIISRNVNVDEGATFRSYADKIKSIQVTANVNVQPLDATENKEYNAGEGNAYNPVTVNVKPNVKTKQISKAGTFKAKDDDCDGYSEVTVNVGSNLTTKNITSEDLPEEPTRVTFKPATDPDHAEFPDRLGYSEVSVDISGKIGESDPILVDPNNFGEEQIFVAKDKGLYGFSKITVRVVESEGPFTIQFYDGNNLWETVTVEHKYSSARPAKGNPPGPEGKKFVGWDPNPLVVVRNMKCYAQYEEEDEESDGEGTLANGETAKSWEKIMANGGADLPIGTKKTIYFGSYSYGGYSLARESVKMQIVAKGEGGTNATWVSVSDGLTCPDPKGWRFMDEGITTNLAKAKSFTGFKDTDLYTTLSGIQFKSNAKDVSDKNTKAFGAMRSVTKYSDVYEYGVGDTPYVQRNEIGDWLKEDAPETYTGLWLLSRKEARNLSGPNTKYYYKGPNSAPGELVIGYACRDIGGVSLRYDDTEEHNLISCEAQAQFNFAYGTSIYPSQFVYMLRFYLNSTVNGYPSEDDIENNHRISKLVIGFCT